MVAAFLSAPPVAYEQAAEPRIDAVAHEVISRPLLGGAKAPPIPDILHRIAWCESNGEHYDERRRVKRGRANPADIGRYQINIEYWGKYAAELGLDLFTEEGNEAMALELYSRYGTSPWSASKACWGGGRA